ncbi:MAG: hypothetical protein CFE24_09135 [Flavobacterium sp. BFFFF2]|nr:MAG: hypothetical protein CFE24_09135 [Flavobacterium sp. BFFFF2]
MKLEKIGYIWGLLSVNIIFMTKTTFTILSICALLLSACTSNVRDVSPITKDEASLNTKIDLMNDDVSRIIEESENGTYLNTSWGKSGASVEVEKGGPSCLSVIRIPSFGSAVGENWTVTKTLDYGTQDCQLSSGNYVRGKIVISYKFTPNNTNRVVSYRFDGFYHNGFLYDGKSTLERSMIEATANVLRHPQFKLKMNLKITSPDGTEYKRAGYKVREHIQGFDTNTTSDDVYSVTGIWSNSFGQAYDIISTISVPLIVKNDCSQSNVDHPKVVQGQISLDRQGVTATIDFGDGTTCTPVRTFTSNGVTVNLD